MTPWAASIVGFVLSNLGFLVLIALAVDLHRRHLRGPFALCLAVMTCAALSILVRAAFVL